MELLTIGAFARVSRLSPKALRLYDELGLLPPARVDPANGYRLYEPAQLERARLVAWLRRIGMPLARILVVCELDAGAAAQQVSAFWAQVEADTATRRDLAAFLIDHLSGKDRDMAHISNPMEIRYAVRTATGPVRDSNQDAAHAGSRVLAVADGFGDRGATASATAVNALKRLDTTDVPAGDLLNVLEDAVAQAGREVRDAVASGSAEAGTTLTAMLWSGSQLALAHVGDTRAYLLRDGDLRQITHDHTLVQAMIDDGRITAEEATAHPQRALLRRALTDGADGAPDLRLHDAEPGDRYLLCSDGLSGVVPAETLRAVLSTATDPERAAGELLALADRAGAPDNITCVVADVTQ